jgi:acetolactate synthase-1/2/3 large subunit
LKITNADLLLKYLENEGVEYVFGVPGLSLVPLFAAINRQDKIKPILAKHEEGAAFMADGYARVKGGLGVCFATSGPGATNLITGVATSYLDNIPVLVLTGQVATSTSGGGAFQDSTKNGVDSVGMFDPITKYSSMIISKYRVGEEIREALRMALTGKKGPVHLSLPKDIMSEEIDAELPSTTSYRPPSEYFDRRLVIEAAEQLVNAQNPVILIGSGVLASKACDEIRDLAETLNIPVATSPKAKGAFPEDHPLSLGVLGFCGSPVAERCLTEGQTDVLLVIGSSLNQMTTSSWDPRLAPTKCLIHVNIDATEIGKNYKTDIPLVGDARTIINEISFRILRYISEDQTPKSNGLARVARIRSEVGICIAPEKMESEAVPVLPQRLIKELERALPKNALLFVDTGNPMCWAIHHMQAKTPDAFICPFGLLTMGYSTAAAIGGKLAAPNRPVVSIVGDGCFLMNGMEIQTAVSHDIPVVWIVENNAKLGLVHEFQRLNFGEKTVVTRFKKIDAAKVAEGLGAKGYTIERPGELEALLPKVIDENRPAVIDCTIADEVPPLGPFVQGLKNFSARLENI